MNNKLINQVLEVYNSSVDDFVDRDDENSNTSDIVKDYLKQIGSFIKDHFKEIEKLDNVNKITMIKMKYLVTLSKKYLYIAYILKVIGDKYKEHKAKTIKKRYLKENSFAL